MFCRQQQVSVAKIFSNNFNKKRSWNLNKRSVNSEASILIILFASVHKSEGSALLHCEGQWQRIQWHGQWNHNPTGPNLKILQTNFLNSGINELFELSVLWWYRKSNKETHFLLYDMMIIIWCLTSYKSKYTEDSTRTEWYHQTYITGDSGCTKTNKSVPAFISN